MRSQRDTPAGTTRRRCWCRGRSSAGGTRNSRVRAALVDEALRLATSLDPDLLLPDSFLELRSAGERTKRIEDVRKSFAQFLRLPKLLTSSMVDASVARGLVERKIVLRLPRADGSARMHWCMQPAGDDLARADAAIVAAPWAVLDKLAPALLAPIRCERVRPADRGAVRAGEVAAMFDGEGAPQLGLHTVLDTAICEAVRRGIVMAVHDEGCPRPQE